ncbi:hypothetical protein [Neobacillus vireti]|uniref:hypothetical protein n=1 Tax=Neobacillus vireti TaxID=220686 RepID=UPI0030003CC9
MKKYLFIFSILLFLVNPSMTMADENQNILRMQELSIKVMPEFAYHLNDVEKNHPPLLIGYQGTLLNQSLQPQKGQIELPLPIEDKNFRIGYVADYSSDLSKVYEIEYIIDQEKGTISWTTSEEIQPNEVYKFVVEFYTNNIIVEEDRKSVAYQFKSFTDIGFFNLTFTPPIGAAKIDLSPAPEKNKSHGDEEGVYSYNVQGMKAGDEKSIVLTYERSETKPSIELMEQQPEQTADNENKKSPEILSIAAISGVGLIGAGAFTFILKRKKTKK